MSSKFELAGWICDILFTYYWLLAHLSRMLKWAIGVSHCPLSVNCFFSKTTELISTKFGRKHLWGMGIQVSINLRAGIYWGPVRGKRGNIWWIFKKSSFHELAIQILWYLTYSILGTWLLKFAHKNKICPKMAPLGGASFFIGLYGEMHLKCSLTKTIKLISTKFGRKHLWQMGI